MTCAWGRDQHKSHGTAVSHGLEELLQAGGKLSPRPALQDEFDQLDRLEVVVGVRLTSQIFAENQDLARRGYAASLWNIKRKGRLSRTRSRQRLFEPMIPLLGAEVIQMIADTVFDNLGQPIQEGAFTGCIERLDVFEARQHGILDNIPRLRGAYGGNYALG